MDEKDKSSLSKDHFRSSQAIMEFIENKYTHSSFATNNSSSITNNTRVILDHLGKIFVDMGAKAEDLRIKLAS